MSWPLLRRPPHGEGTVDRREQPPSDCCRALRRVVGVGDEVEAFMQGRLVEHLVGAGRPVPAWAVLNKLAHGSLDELAGLAKGGAAPGDASSGEPGWLCAQRMLAGDLVRGATRPEEVVAVQLAVLVPLELWVIQRSRAEAVTSRWVIDLATATLAVHRSTG